MEVPCRRRHTDAVRVGNVMVGGDNPVVIQSMTSTSTMDTAGSAAQIRRIVDAGGQIVRLTAQGVREAKNLKEISALVRSQGVDVPLVADIHFNPNAAFEAALHVEKVRINPGNFVDPGRTFKKIEFTDEEYSREVEKISDTLTPFLKLCRSHGTAVRLGVNHGSLSDRIMSRYGDTPAGMVESVMEFLRVCRKVDFKDVVISIKASNVTVMVATVKLLVEALDREDMHYPLHLGVTEAGDGEDGRVKSAVGIGYLLSLGIGDTIRVSLSEEPECEIPVAQMILRHIDKIASAPAVELPDDMAVACRRSVSVPVVPGVDFPSVSATGFVMIDAASPVADGIGADDTVVLFTSDANFGGSIRRGIASLRKQGVNNRIIIRADYSGISSDEVVVAASIDLGSLLLDGFADGIMVQSDALTADEAANLALNILQATRLRISKTEYIACPGCGRTLYDLQAVLRDIRQATSHLKGLKIGVMGCIVNGPGEMADADYGYVGSGVGKVNLYKGKECVAKSVPASEAIDRLIDLIKQNGDWTDA